jgi:toxin CcdB
MAQFDVHRNPRRGDYPLLLDMQANLLSQLATRVVVPMTPLKDYPLKPLTRLNPTVRVRGTEYVLVFQELAAIPKSALGETRGSLSTRRSDLLAALDLLFTGI